MTELRAIADYYYSDSGKDDDDFIVATKDKVYRGQICLDPSNGIRFVCFCDDGRWRDLGIYCFVLVKYDLSQ